MWCVWYVLSQGRMDIYKQMVYDNKNSMQKKMTIFGIIDQSNYQVLYTINKDVRKHTVGCWIIAWDRQKQLTFLMRIYCVITNVTGGNVRATLPESLICLSTCIILCAHVSLWPDWESMRRRGWLILFSPCSRRLFRNDCKGESRGGALIMLH